MEDHFKSFETLSKLHSHTQELEVESQLIFWCWTVWSSAMAGYMFMPWVVIPKGILKFGGSECLMSALLRVQKEVLFPGSGSGDDQA